MMLKSDTIVFLFSHFAQTVAMVESKESESYPLVDIVTIDATLHNLMGM